jgi:glutathione S-transferase
VLRLYRIPFSTNVERVTLALAHKRLAYESEWIEPGDRSAVRAISGQDLVPVLVDGDAVIADSTRILEHLEDRFPEPPLYPRDPARRAEVTLFVDWFNRVWKVAPNALADLLDAGAPDPAAVAPHAAALRAALDHFEALLAGRDHLLGEFGAADCAAWPFLRYAAAIDPEDTETFHRVLHEHQRLDGRYPRLAAWIERIGRRPRG